MPIENLDIEAINFDGVGLYGPDPGSEELFSQKNSRSYLPFRQQPAERKLRSHPR